MTVFTGNAFYVENVYISGKLMRSCFPHRLNLFALILLGMILSVPLHAQLKTKVTVNLSQSKATVYTTSFGIAADRWDNGAYDAATIKLLQDAGITDLRFPGNGGIDARYDYGELAIEAGKTITETPVENLGPTFTVEVPRYGITAIVVPKAQ